LISLRVQKVRIVLNPSGIRELLKREETENMLLDRAETVAAVANIRYTEHPVGARNPGDDQNGVDDSPERITAVAVAGRDSPTRARARVFADHPAALAVEASHRVLGSSMDAAGLGGGKRRQFRDARGRFRKTTG
jgi:hypothetical protein